MRQIIKIGEFTITQEGDYLFLSRPSGEGMEPDIKQFEDLLAKYYDKYF